MFSLLKKYELWGAKRRVRLFNRFRIESVQKSLSLTKIICWERLVGVPSLRRLPDTLTSRFTTQPFQHVAEWHHAGSYIPVYHRHPLRKTKVLLFHRSRYESYRIQGFQHDTTPIRCVLQRMG